MIVNKCENCKFWLRINDTKTGRCHRNPPTLGFHLMLKQNIMAPKMATPEVMETINWPRTNETDFCGEFK